MQDNKNLILAIALCLIVLFGWGHFAEYMGWVKPAPVPVPEEAPEKTMAPPSDQARKMPPPPLNPAPGREFTVATPLYDAVFYTGGGALRSCKLKKYRSGMNHFMSGRVL
ncbi:MAG: hypothetical protein K2H64_09085 [Desulfovibrio sp.]|nr:hypothetical protein [Desulfovibrio sp.]